MLHVAGDAEMTSPAVGEGNVDSVIGPTARPLVERDASARSVGLGDS